MRKHIFLLAIFTAVLTTLHAQPKFTPARTVANVGEIMFQTPYRVTFEFTNTGNAPLVVTSVVPSCGCTTAKAPDKPVPAGEKCEIIATYDAAMLGVFSKELAVFTNVSDEPVYLTFQGKVTTNPAVSSDDFPIDLDNIRLDKNVVEFDDVNKGDRPTVELQVLNTGRQAYVPQLMHLPPYLTAEYVPQQLAGGRVGKIFIHLDSDKMPAMGLNQTSIYLARFSGDKIGDDNEISVSSVLLPDFRKDIATGMAFVPKMRLNKDTLRLTEENRDRKILAWPPLSKTTTKSGEIIITNTGRSNLDIARLQVFNRAISVSLSSRKIAPGEKAKLKITVDERYLTKDKNRLRILLITNDPNEPKKIIPVVVSK